MYDLVFIHTGFYDNELAWPAELGSYSSACNPEIQQLRGAFGHDLTAFIMTLPKR